jgi:hypothetical protein
VFRSCKDYKCKQLTSRRPVDRMQHVMNFEALLLKFTVENIALIFWSPMVQKSKGMFHQSFLVFIVLS